MLALVMKRLTALLIMTVTLQAAEPYFQGELIFPLDKLHNHSSSLVELPGGELLACWYSGSGERTADDVKIEAARKKPTEATWGGRFTLIDTPGFPDANPVLWLDGQQKLWLFWPIIIANEWHTALLESRVATVYPQAGKPVVWSAGNSILLKPQHLEERLTAWLDRVEPTLTSERMKAEAKLLRERAKDKYFSRLGWMPRVHPLRLSTGRILLPLYSDGYDLSLMAISNDGGLTWQASEPLVSAGGVQPTLIEKKDGTIVAYLRDNGPPPQRLLRATSSDGGLTWSDAVDTEIRNPGSSVEVIKLRDGGWLMVNNDTEKGRASLVVTMSDDEGRTWRWSRHLENDAQGSFSYPSVIQARDGRVHVTYSYVRNDVPKGEAREAIKHVAFDEAWVKAGDLR